MQHYQPKTILVTGGAGFIGANFVHYIIKADPTVKVINLDLLTYAGKKENLNGLSDPSRHTFIQGDICDRKLVDNLLRQYQIDTIVHFAAESHVDRSIAGPEAFVRTNVMGTFALLDAARNYWLQEQQWHQNQCRFHHISTDEVYGMLSAMDPAFTETTAYAPNSPYSASKAGSDHLVRAYFHTYGLPTTTSNCSNNYGPYQDQEKLIPKVIDACLHQKPIPVYGNGLNIRDWLYVEDHCTGIDAILRTGVLGETYNIGGCSERSNIDVVYSICDLMEQKFNGKTNYRNLITFVQDRPGHDWRYAINNEKISQKLSWKPTVNFEQGLKNTIDWYCNG
jgi:dTDP-glucose 4,6-dehydratase